MSTELWSSATHRSGADLTTELDALGTLSYSAVGPELANQTNLDIWCIAVLSVDFVSAPGLNEVVQLFAVVAVDGTNYEDGGASLRYPQDSFCGVFQVFNTTSAQVMATR